MLRKLHLVTGVLGVIAFLVTGQYMDRAHAHLAGMSDGPRMIYRSAHIYLLFAALLNLLLGAYLRLAADRVLRAAQVMASVVLLATPAMFAMAFLTEPALAGLERPWARPAIYLSLGAVAFHALIGAGVRGRDP